MQEVVKHSARDDYCLVDSLTEEVHHQTVQHVSFIVDSDSWEAPSWLYKAKQLKSHFSHQKTKWVHNNFENQPT